MSSQARTDDGDAARWRAMAAGDLAAVHALSMSVHPLHPERAVVLAEKFRLFPRGCFVLARSAGVCGYCFSHPWTKGPPPVLDALLGAIPERPASYFVHDLTLAADMRGAGHGRALVPALIDAARMSGLDHISLVAVNRRAPFWQAAGFSATADAALQALVRTKYGEGALHMQRRLG